MARRRQTVAQHARLRAPSIARQLVTLVAVAVAVVLVAGAGTIAYATYDLASTFADDAVDLGDDLVVPPDIGQIEGGVNMMVTGIDLCEDEIRSLFGDRCEGEDGQTRLNDVNILLHISDEPRRVTVVSFPRDLVFDSAGCTRTDGTPWGGGTVQINELYGVGGLPCITNAVSELSGQAIPFAATVTFKGVIDITNAVGGVEVCLARPMYDPNTGIDWPAGMRTVQGMDALQFLRTRQGVGGSDLARVSNQQQYMSRLARTIISDEVLSDPATVYRLASSALRSVTPNDRLTNPLTLVQIAMAVREVPFDEITFVQYPVLDSPTDPNRVVPNYSAARPLWQALADNQPIQLTGDVAVNGGTVEITPEDGTETPPDTAAPAESADPAGPADPAPEESAVALPPSVSGSTAAQETCSAGNVRG